MTPSQMIKPSLHLITPPSCFITQSPATMFSEDYQVATVKRYFPVFDRYRGKFFIGEMIWNFADFATAAGELFVI